MAKRRIAVLGSTGSIGTQTLDVVRQHGDKLEIVGLAVNSSLDVLLAQARKFGVRHLAVGNAALANDPRCDEARALVRSLAVPEDQEDAEASFGVGPEAVVALTQLPEVDVVVNALVGAAGLEASYATLKAGKVLALANKESLVVGGDLIMPLAAAVDADRRASGVAPATGPAGALMPIDSEHGAIYQCLLGENPREVSKLWVTASGGPFRGKTIADLVTMPVDELIVFFNAIELDEHDTKTASRILVEIRNRLQYLADVGLGYLTLDRLSSTLSGGESQRINLSTSLGSNLTGSLYILDEPSIGLHPRDTNRLIGVLKQLRDLGNTVIVVEHEEEVIRAADWIVDIGPKAGYNGGEVVFSGTLPQLLKNKKSLTADYLTGRREIAVPTTARGWSNSITVKGARENNLRNIDVRIPLAVMTCITGVSGSGKSSLAKGILYPALRRLLYDTGVKPGDFDGLTGDVQMLKSVEMVDQNPIGKSSRSNPVTYIKAYDEIRKLYADQPYAQHTGVGASAFSFNIAGGRCEECQGEGVIKVSMQFMADVELVCEACGGRRFRDEILEVKYRDKSIYDVLEMTVDDAIAFFGEDSKKNATCRRIVERLQPLQDVGLGYIKLGQSSSTLSGGESQRVKLASFLTKDSAQGGVMFIFDEPTTGLHFHDISKLLAAFNALIKRDHTIVIVEHNMDIIKCADWVVDLGPEAGTAGGQVVFEGTPRGLEQCPESHTGQFLELRSKLIKNEN